VAYEKKNLTNAMSIWISNIANAFKQQDPVVVNGIVDQPIVCHPLDVLTERHGLTVTVSMTHDGIATIDLIHGDTGTCVLNGFHICDVDAVDGVTAKIAKMVDDKIGLDAINDLMGTHWSKFVLIDTHAVTPNLMAGSVDVEAETPIEAVADLTGVPTSDLIVRTWGLAKDVWHVSAKSGKIDVSVIVVKR